MLVRQLARVRVQSALRLSSSRLGCAVRFMGGHGHDAHHDAHGHGHGHSEPLPTTHIKSAMDLAPRGSTQIRGTAVSKHTNNYYDVLTAHVRKSPFPYTDARNPDYLTEAPHNEGALPAPPEVKTSKTPFLVALLLFGGIGAALAYMESKKKPAWMEPAAASGLDAKAFNAFKLLEVKPYNHDTKQFVFALAAPDAKLNLTTASFVLFKSPNQTADGKDVIRPYTPIDQHVPGQVRFLVKKYPGAAMGGYLFDMKPGDSVFMKGPVQKIKYTANMKKEIGMIAGGTGITPMLQVIDEVLSNPVDTSKISLVFGNNTPADILLKERLDELAARYPTRFSVHYIVAKGDANWKGDTGFVTEALIKKYIPASSKDSITFVCGPPAMMKAVSGDKVKSPEGAMLQGTVEGMLKNLNYTSDTVFKF